MTAREQLLQALNDPGSCSHPGTDFLLRDYLEVLGCSSDCCTCFDETEDTWHFSFYDNDRHLERAIAATKELVTAVRFKSIISMGYSDESL